MSKLEVQKVDEPQSWNGKNGSTFYNYKVMGLLDGELDQVTLTVSKIENAPKKGDVLEGTVEDKGQYGKKFKKEQAKWGNVGPSGAKWQKPDEKEKLPGFALSYAKDIIVAQIAAKEKIEKPVADTIKYADVLLKWLQNAQEGAREPQPQQTPPAKQQPLPEPSHDEIEVSDEFIEENL